MRLITGWPAGAFIPRRSVVTIGVFDGVHFGHQQLIRATRLLAKKRRVAAGVITFDPDPQHVIDPNHEQPSLMPGEERLRVLSRQGVDWIWVIPFSRRVAQTTAEAFSREILVKQLHVSAVVVGGGFLFGKDREGTLKLLKKKVSVVAIGPIRRLGLPISSSRIRRLIQEGRLAEARVLLGRAPSLFGKVVTGAGRGRLLGFPTANIQVTSQALPPQGVYAVSMRCRNQNRFWPGVMNFGHRPTFGGGPAICEVHLLKFSGRLVGRPVEVRLIRRLRGERCFSGPAALQAQVRQDIIRARKLL